MCLKCFWHSPSLRVTPGVMSIEKASYFSSSAVSCVITSLLRTRCAKSSYRQKIEGNTRCVPAVSKAYFPDSVLMTLKWRMSPVIYTRQFSGRPRATTAIFLFDKTRADLRWSLSILCSLYCQSMAQYISSVFSVYYSVQVERSRSRQADLMVSCASMMKVNTTLSCQLTVILVVMLWPNGSLGDNCHLSLAKLYI